MVLSIIAAIGKNNELGKKNDLLWNLPEDMKYFRTTTSGHPIVMGQKTYLSLAKDSDGKQIGRILPGRRNIILSSEPSLKIDGAEIVHTFPELMFLLANSIKGDEEAFVIGGGQIYQLLIEKADKLYITHVDATFPDAEIFFPSIDNTKWEKTKSKKYVKDAQNNYDMEFAEYTKKVF